jgi:hypothetical protein
MAVKARTAETYLTRSTRRGGDCFERLPTLGLQTSTAAISLNQTFTLSQEQTLTEHSPNTGPGIPVADLSRATEQGKSERFPRGHDAMSAQQGP